MMEMKNEFQLFLNLEIPEKDIVITISKYLAIDFASENINILDPGGFIISTSYSSGFKQGILVMSYNKITREKVIELANHLSLSLNVSVLIDPDFFTKDNGDDYKWTLIDKGESFLVDVSYLNDGVEPVVF